MNLETKSNNESEKKDKQIEDKINEVLDEINKEFKFKGNALKRLLDFKLSAEKKEVIEDSSEYRSALIAEIERNVDSGDILPNNSELSQAECEALASKIIEINRLNREVQVQIKSLKEELSSNPQNDSILSSSSLMTRRFYSESMLRRVDNPENLQDQFLGLLVAGVETVAVVSKFAYDLGKGVVLSPYHLIKVLMRKAKYDGIEI